MAIGTATALLGSAIIGAGASALSSKSASKTAANANQYAADQSAALQREALATQQANTAKAREGGDAAITQLMSRLGLQAPATQGSTPQVAQPAQNFDYKAYAAANPDVVAEANKPDSFLRGATPEERIALHYADHGAAEIAAGQRNSGQTTQQAQPAPQTDVALSPQTQVPTYTTPTFQRPEYDKNLDVSMEAFKNSPEYQAALYDITKQGGQVQASLAAQGLLNSGAALKRLQEVGQDNTVKYYGDYRDYTTGQYNTDRSRFDQNYNYDTSLKAQQFNTDRAYGTDLALANRAYETGRYDNTTNALFNLANIGQGASSQYGNALQNTANNQSNALFSNAAATGNAALANASNMNSLIGQGVNALAYYYGNKGTAA